MDRREALMGLVAGASGGIAKDFFPKKEKGRFLLVVYLYVGCLSPVKIEAFIERLRKKFQEEKPDNFHFLFIPDRHHSTWVDVYTLDGEPITEEITETWFKKILADGKIFRVDGDCLEQEQADDTKIIEFCKIMFGAPVVPDENFPPTFEQDVEDTIRLGRQYRIAEKRLQGFVYDSLRLRYSDDDFELDGE